MTGARTKSNLSPLARPELLCGGLGRSLGVFISIAAAFAMTGPRSLAYELSFAETGHKPTSGTIYVIEREIKQLMATHERLFKRKAPEGFKITFHIFPSREEFKAYAVASGKSVPDSVTGYARPRSAIVKSEGRRKLLRREAEVVTWKHALPEQHLSTLLHETTHAVTFAFLHNAPLWVLEGGAEWFGRPAWANGRDQNEERARMWQWLANRLSRKELPALRAFLTTETYEDWDEMFPGGRAQGYGVSYSLFQFFMSQPDSQTFLATVLTAKDVEFATKPGSALAITLDKLWRGGLPAIEKGWHEWIRQRARMQKVSEVKDK